MRSETERKRECVCPWWKYPFLSDAKNCVSEYLVTFCLVCKGTMCMSVVCYTFYTYECYNYVDCGVSYVFCTSKISLSLTYIFKMIQWSKSLRLYCILKIPILPAYIELDSNLGLGSLRSILWPHSRCHSKVALLLPPNSALQVRFSGEGA